MTQRLHELDMNGFNSQIRVKVSALADLLIRHEIKKEFYNPINNIQPILLVPLIKEYTFLTIIKMFHPMPGGTFFFIFAANKSEKNSNKS